MHSQYDKADDISKSMHISLLSLLLAPLSKRGHSAKSILQNAQKCAVKHIFSPKYLVDMEKSSTFAPCFSWY